MNNQQTQSPLDMEWVEVKRWAKREQAYLRKQINPNHIDTHIDGETERELRKWLFRVTSKTMDSVTPMERCGKIVLTEFYPDQEVSWSGQQQFDMIDPVLPIPLIHDLANDGDFVKAFRALYRTQQDFVNRGGPDSQYGQTMLANINTIKDTSLESHLSDEESAYFWDKILDIAANPYQYLTLPKQGMPEGVKYAGLFILIVIITLAVLTLFAS